MRVLSPEERKREEREIKVNWWADNLFIENIIICIHAVCLRTSVLMRTENLLILKLILIITEVIL